MVVSCCNNNVLKAILMSRNFYILKFFKLQKILQVFLHLLLVLCKKWHLATKIAVT